MFRLTAALLALLVTQLMFAGVSDAQPLNKNVPLTTFPDTHTLALWLFDEPHYPTMILTDAGPHYWDLRLDVRSASLDPGRFGNALTLSPTGGVATRWARGIAPRSSRLVPFDHSPRQMIAALAGSDWTLEFWIRLAVTPAENVVILEMGPRGTGPHTTLRLSAGAGPFVFQGELSGAELHCPINNRVLADKRWHHVAFVFDHTTRQMRHWMDGQPQIEAMSKGWNGEVDLTMRPGLVQVIDSGLFLARPHQVTVEPQINFSADEPTGPASRLWRGMIEAPLSGKVTFGIEADDGVRLTVNGHVVIARCASDGVTSGQIEMRKGVACPIELKYYHSTDNAAFARLYWSWEGHSRELVPAEALAHVADRRATWEKVAAVDTAASQGGYVLSIGRAIDGSQPFDGQLDELRFSDVIRYNYKDAFEPGTHSRNWSRRSRPAKPNGPPLLFGPHAETGAVLLGSRKHVFIDEVLVEKKQNVQLTLNSPYDAVPLDFKLDQPWDAEFGVDTFYDYQGKVRAVYHNGGLWKRRENLLCLAESTDGFTFEPSIVGTVESRGSTDNNIITTYPGQGSWLVDANPQCPPEEKIKFTCFGMERGAHLFVSPDGTHLRRNETTALFSDVGGGVECFWDDQRGMYVTHLRHEGFVRGNRGAEGRAAFRAQTREILKPWPMNRLLNPQPDKITEEFPIPFQPSEAGQVYRTRAIKYPWAPDVYLAFPWRMIGDHVIMQTELATSRDGMHWDFWGGNPYYLGVGDKTEGRILMCYGLIRRGDEIWQYAQETEPAWVGHLKDVKHGYQHHLSRLKQRLDGFVSLDAGERTGTMTTRDLIFSGERLTVNAAAHGHLRVAVLNPDGTEVPGFGLDDCPPIRTDSTCHEVRWTSGESLGNIQGYVVRVHFEMQGAKLYAFQFRAD